MSGVTHQVGLDRRASFGRWLRIALLLIGLYCIWQILVSPSVDNTILDFIFGGFIQGTNVSISPNAMLEGVAAIFGLGILILAIKIIRDQLYLHRLTRTVSKAHAIAQTEQRPEKAAAPEIPMFETPQIAAMITEPELPAVSELPTLPAFSALTAATPAPDIAVAIEPTPVAQRLSRPAMHMPSFNVSLPAMPTVPKVTLPKFTMPKVTLPQLDFSGPLAWLKHMFLLAGFIIRQFFKWLGQTSVYIVRTVLLLARTLVVALGQFVMWMVVSFVKLLAIVGLVLLSGAVIVSQALIIIGQVVVRSSVVLGHWLVRVGRTSAQAGYRAGVWTLATLKKAYEQLERAEIWLAKFIAHESKVFYVWFRPHAWHFDGWLEKQVHQFLRWLERSIHRSEAMTVLLDAGREYSRNTSKPKK